MPASARPNSSRTAMSIGTAAISAVSPVKSDHAITIAVRKARGP
jgi:hypothetical protein